MTETLSNEPVYEGLNRFDVEAIEKGLGESIEAIGKIGNEYCGIHSTDITPQLPDEIQDKLMSCLQIDRARTKKSIVELASLYSRAANLVNDQYAKSFFLHMSTLATETMKGSQNQKSRYTQEGPDLNTDKWREPTGSVRDNMKAEES